MSKLSKNLDKSGLKQPKNPVPASTQLLRIIQQAIEKLERLEREIIDELNVQRAAPPVQRVQVVAQPEPEVAAVARDIALTHIRAMRAALKQRGSDPSR